MKYEKDETSIEPEVMYVLDKGVVLRGRMQRKRYWIHVRMFRPYVGWWTGAKVPGIVRYTHNHYISKNGEKNAVKLLRSSFLLICGIDLYLNEIIEQLYENTEYLPEHDISDDKIGFGKRLQAVLKRNLGDKLWDIYSSADNPYILEILSTYRKTGEKVYLGNPDRPDYYPYRNGSSS